MDYENTDIAYNNVTNTEARSILGTSGGTGFCVHSSGRTPAQLSSRRNSRRPTSAWRTKTQVSACT